MRIGIVCSGYEGLVMASLLPDEVSIVLFMDWLSWPGTSKGRDDIVPRIEYGIQTLMHEQVDAILVSPYAEAFFGGMYQKIVPLFRTYLQNSVLPSSRIGKLGLLSMHTPDVADMIQRYIQDIISSYTLTPYQQKTSGFINSFSLYQHNCSHHITHLSYGKIHSHLMRHIVKDDLRVFKNAAVDSIIPGDRGLLYREKMIRHRLGAHMRFHGKKEMSALIAQTGTISGEKSTAPGTVTVLTTATPTQLIDTKDRRQLLDRGGKREVSIKSL